LFATTLVRSRVEPGGISICTWLKSRLSGGWKVIGSVANEKIVAMKAATPISIVVQRFFRDQRSIPT
jgi:hypothetical protein